jgi:hypothetical protein
VTLNKTYGFFPFEDDDFDRVSKANNDSVDAINLNTAFRKKFLETTPTLNDVWIWNQVNSRWQPGQVSNSVNHNDTWNLQGGVSGQYYHLTQGEYNSISTVSNKADKVSGAVSGNLAGLDQNGNLTDTGNKPADFENAGAVSSHETSYTHANLPSSDQKNALAGTAGSPSSSNKYVTNDDSRMTDARTPAAHDHERFKTIITTGQVISALKVITLDTSTGKGIYADRNTPAHANRILGVSYTSGDEDENIIVITSGEITDSSWSWDTSKPVFLGNDGTLTQTAPTTGFRVIIGFPVSATTLNIQIQESIRRV